MRMDTSPSTSFNEEDEDELAEHAEHGEEEVRGRETTRSGGRARFAGNGGVNGGGGGVEVSMSKSLASESEECTMED